MPIPTDNSPFGYRAPGAANGTGAPNVLFVSTSCSHCKGAFDLANQPKYKPYVEVLKVNESAEAYQRMADAGVFQTPTMKTPSGLVSGGERIEEYLRRTYG